MACSSRGWLEYRTSMDGERKQRATAAFPGISEPRLLWHMGRPREERDLSKVTQTVHALDLSPSSYLAATPASHHQRLSAEAKDPGLCGGLSVHIGWFQTQEAGLSLRRRTSVCSVPRQLLCMPVCAHPHPGPLPHCLLGKALRDKWRQFLPSGTALP